MSSVMLPGDRQAFVIFHSVITLPFFIQADWAVPWMECNYWGLKLQYSFQYDHQCGISMPLNQFYPPFLFCDLIKQGNLEITKRAKAGSIQKSREWGALPGLTSAQFGRSVHLSRTKEGVWNYLEMKQQVWIWKKRRGTIKSGISP